MKQRIDHLIESEYMVRDEHEHSVYHYVAWNRDEIYFLLKIEKIFN